MKKSIMTVAVLGVVSGAALAQSSVTVYGKVDLGAVVDNGPAGHTVRVSSGVTGGSRLGFKGVEDLGGGYKVGFQIETGFCADSAAGAPNFCTGSNQFMGRQAHGDLTGPFGALSAGRQYSLGFLSFATLDPFGAGMAGQADNTDGRGVYLVDPSAIRLNNSVTYVTPTFAGFSGAVELALGEQAGDWRKSRETGGALVYVQGPAYAAVTIYDQNNANGAGTARRNLTGGGTYDFGFAKVHALVQRVTGSPAGGASVDVVSLLGGVTVPLASGSVLASYAHRHDRTAAAQDAHQVGIGYLYPLSKRTSAYTAFARLVNRNGGALHVGSATEIGTGNQAFNLGVVHNF
jgi:predicted porin